MTKKSNTSSQSLEKGFYFQPESVNGKREKKVTLFVKGETVIVAEVPSGDKAGNRIFVQISPRKDKSNETHIIVVANRELNPVSAKSLDLIKFVPIETLITRVKLGLKLWKKPFFYIFNPKTLENQSPESRLMEWTHSHSLTEISKNKNGFEFISKYAMKKKSTNTVNPPVPNFRGNRLG